MSRSRLSGKQAQPAKFRSFRAEACLHEQDPWRRVGQVGPRDADGVYPLEVYCCNRCSRAMACECRPLLLEVAP